MTTDSNSIFRRMGSVISDKIEAAKLEFQTSVSTAVNTLQTNIDNAKTELETSTDSKILIASNSQYRNTPYDIATAVVNKPSGSAKVLRFVAPRLFKIPANCVGSLFRAGTVANKSCTFLMYKNSIQIGTITFSAGVANATVVSDETIFDLGDSMSIIAPPIQDTKLADIMITIVARL